MLREYSISVQWSDGDVATLRFTPTPEQFFTPVLRASCLMKVPSDGGAECRQRKLFIESMLLLTVLRITCTQISLKFPCVIEFRFEGHYYFLKQAHRVISRMWLNTVENLWDAEVAIL